MLSFTHRRLINATITVALIAIAYYWAHRRTSELQSSSFQTGYVLLGLVFLLMSYNWRKKLAAVPLGSSAVWLQVHVYCGFGAIAIFMLHTGFRLPNGILETILYVLFLIVAGSGIYGLQLTRSVPKKITKLREQVTLERIPSLRVGVRQRAHDVVVGLLREYPAPTLADFYKDRLLSYFHLQRSPWYYAFPTGKLRNQILAEMSDLQRYYSPPESETDQELRRLVDQRDDLDYHDAMQRKLRFWLFAHICLTYCLIVLAAFHAILAHAFRGAM